MLCGVDLEIGRLIPRILWLLDEVEAGRIPMTNKDVFVLCDLGLLMLFAVERMYRDLYNDRG